MTRTILAVVATFSLAGTVSAGFINGGFETGNFTGWSVAGAVPTQINVAPVIFGASAPEGTFHAGGVTGPVSQAGLETFFGFGAGSLDTMLGRDVFGGTALSQAVTLTDGQVLTFRWQFYSGEATGGDPTFNDTAFVVISNTASVLGDTFTAILPGNVTGYQQFSFEFPAGGTYNIGVGVANVGDNTFTSGFTADNFAISTPAPPAIFAFAIGGLGLAAVRRIRRTA